MPLQAGEAGGGSCLVSAFAVRASCAEQEEEPLTSSRCTSERHLLRPAARLAAFSHDSSSSRAFASKFAGRLSAESVSGRDLAQTSCWKVNENSIGRIVVDVSFRVCVAVQLGRKGEEAKRGGETLAEFSIACLAARNEI